MSAKLVPLTFARGRGATHHLRFPQPRLPTRPTARLNVKTPNKVLRTYPHYSHVLLSRRRRVVHRFHWHRGRGATHNHRFPQPHFQRTPSHNYTLKPRAKPSALATIAALPPFTPSSFSQQSFHSHGSRESPHNHCFPQPPLQRTPWHNKGFLHKW
jgi:hypothetical protein